MKSFSLFLLIAISFFCNSCKKDSGCTPVSPDVEDPQIVEYNIKNGLNCQRYKNTIYYNAIDTGYGISPTIDSKVTVTYTARYLNNKIFDASTVPINFKLSDVIEGWQIGLPLLKKGGRILLIIPSAYAYGCNGNTNLSVPENQILIYDIKLIDVIP